MSEEPSGSGESRQGPMREIVQPFIDLVHAPRALWGVNLGYVIEGMVYFGMLGYLAIYFSDFVFQGVEHADEYSHNSVMVLTAGITIAMFFLGFVADKRGVRFALIAAFVLMLVGRIIISGAPNVMGLEPPRPGVFAGDTVTLHVKELRTRDGLKTITKASVIANQHGLEMGVEPFVKDLSVGEGVVPDASLEHRVVRLGPAKVVEGEGQSWRLEYGNKPVTARLLIHSADAIGLCEGATLSLRRAYVEREGDEDDPEFVIRSHWVDDIAELDRSGCEEPLPEGDSIVHEDALKADSRWPVEQPAQSLDQLQQLDIGAVQEQPDGPANFILPDASVTYVRNGGYFLQQSTDGPVLTAFVNPLGSRLHLVTLAGILLVVIGYGMYQPAAYAAVRQFTSPKTAAMGFAMLYALMNLGGWLPSFAFLLRDDDFLGLGISGTFWVYTGFTALALLLTAVILSRKTVEAAIADAKTETAAIKESDGGTSQPDEHKQIASSETTAPAESTDREAGDDHKSIPLHLWGFAIVCLICIYWRVPEPWNLYGAIGGAVLWIIACFIPLTSQYVARHPLSDLKFFYFIFALIPVQTLFTYNWFILPQYISRAFEGWIGEYFEIASNANPILIFIAVPIITAMTQKAKVYNMMIYGTLIMAAPAFLLAIGPYAVTLFAYIFLMTIGEAMWQPRFLQYAAEIAPEGRTGQYMGVAQLPWFLTKMVVPLLYSGWMMDRYCPAEGERNTQIMWLVFACIAMVSTVLLVAAKGWLGKDFKTKAD